jgi:hypothetical protein
MALDAVVLEFIAVLLDAEGHAGRSAFSELSNKSSKPLERSM